MKLTRPIITFDLETTGTNVNKDKIVQIAAIKLFPDGSVEQKNTLINPEIPIPKEASDVHGITDEMVANKPTFKQIAVSLKAWFKDCDLSGFNQDKFDIPLLCAEFELIGIEFLDWDFNSIDVLSLYRKLYPNKLTDIYKRLFGFDFDGAHDALNDVLASNEVLWRIIEDNSDQLEVVGVKEIDSFIQGDRKRYDIAGKIYINPDGVHCWTFGKNIDKPVLSDYGFLNWVLANDFPLDTKRKLRLLIEKNK